MINDKTPHKSELMDIIDVSTWKVDEKNEIFPVGARDKEMIWSPSTGLADGLKAEWPYLFKESIYRYEDQFWTEIVAYIVSKYLNVSVPPAFPAVKIDKDGVKRYGALLEWFYKVDEHKFIHGAQYFKQINPDFDDKLGAQHNIQDFKIICRALKRHSNLKGNELIWLSDMVLFDCLIGNTDRHQENWGIVFKAEESYLSPLFDNGTSLGHERCLNLIENWTDDRFNSYLMKGQHHFRYTRENPKVRIKHFDFIEKLAEDTKLKEYMRTKIHHLDMDGLLDELYALTTIDCDIVYSEERYNWMKRILLKRLDLIKERLQ